MLLVVTAVEVKSVRVIAFDVSEIVVAEVGVGASCGVQGIEMIPDDDGVDVMMVMGKLGNT